MSDVREACKPWCGLSYQHPLCPLLYVARPGCEGSAGGYLLGFDGGPIVWCTALYRDERRPPQPVCSRCNGTGIAELRSDGVLTGTAYCPVCSIADGRIKQSAPQPAPTVSQGDAGILDGCRDALRVRIENFAQDCDRGARSASDVEWNIDDIINEATAALRADLARVTAERNALAVKLGEALKHIADDDIRAQFASIDNAGTAAKGTP